MHDSQDDTIRTQVGRAVPGDNLFRGYSVKDELVGKLTYWQMLSLSIHGPELDEFDCKLLDVMMNATGAADPRIWPLKMTRVAGAYGGLWSAMCSSFILGDGASIGCGPCGRAARYIKRIRQLLEQTEHPEQLDTFKHVLQQVNQELGPRLPGFGVPGRGEDERFIAIQTWYDAHRPDDYPCEHWKIVQRMQPIMVESYALRMNIVTCLTPLLLDMGFDDSQVALMVFFLVMPCYVANAYEATAVPEAMIPERVKSSAVRYVGKPASIPAHKTSVDDR